MYTYFWVCLEKERQSPFHPGNGHNKESIRWKPHYPCKEGNKIININKLHKDTALGVGGGRDCSIPSQNYFLQKGTMEVSLLGTPAPEQPGS